MDLTGKKQFESLDWLTQTIEPFEWEGTATLAAFPNEVELPIDLVIKLFIEGYGDCTTILKELAPKYGVTSEQFNKSIYQLQNCFDIRIADDTIVNLDENFMTGSVTLIKKKKEFTEKEILDIMVYEMQNAISIKKNDDFSRINEIIEILDLSYSVKRSVSKKNKVLAIKGHITEKVANGEWKIRDVSLARNIVSSMCDYINDGNMKSLDMFLRFKMMTHSGLPIYKVEVENESD